MNCRKKKWNGYYIEAKIYIDQCINVKFNEKIEYHKILDGIKDEG